LTVSNKIELVVESLVQVHIIS